FVESTASHQWPSYSESRLKGKSDPPVSAISDSSMNLARFGFVTIAGVNRVIKPISTLLSPRLKIIRSSSPNKMQIKQKANKPAVQEERKSSKNFFFHLYPCILASNLLDKSMSKELWRFARINSVKPMTIVLESKTLVLYLLGRSNDKPMAILLRVQGFEKFRRFNEFDEIYDKQEERVRPFLHDSPDFVPGREKNGKKKEVFISHCDDSLYSFQKAMSAVQEEKSSRTFLFYFNLCIQLSCLFGQEHVRGTMRFDGINSDKPIASEPWQQGQTNGHVKSPRLKKNQIPPISAILYIR
ncbi:hypothetical protein CEXT_119501, partial [Caerostris extrusa]